jgi:hypothetical protein
MLMAMLATASALQHTSSLAAVLASALLPFGVSCCLGCECIDADRQAYGKHLLKELLQLAIVLIELQLRAVEAHLRHLLADHAAASGVRKVDVVEVAQERRRVLLR